MCIRDSAYILHLSKCYGASFPTDGVWGRKIDVFRNKKSRFRKSGNDIPPYNFRYRFNTNIHTRSPPDVYRGLVAGTGSEPGLHNRQILHREVSKFLSVARTGVISARASTHY